jgi:hypothetical protein
MHLAGRFALFGHVQLCAAKCGRRPLVAGYTRDERDRVCAGRHQLSTPLIGYLLVAVDAVSVDAQEHIN